MKVELESGPIPLYHQLEQHLLARVRSGEFAPSSLLPTESRLGQTYGVSRITVRKALDSLMQQGVIIRRRGIGSFVAERGGVHSVRLTGSLDEFLQSAQQLQSRVISLATVPVDKEVASALELGKGDAVTRLELVTSGQDGPLGHLVIYFPESIGRMLAIEDVAADVPVIRMVEQRISASVVRAEQLILPAIASQDAVRHLGVVAGTPTLRVRRIYYTAAGRPIEAAFIQYHPERYRYAVELRAGPRPV